MLDNNRDTIQNLASIDLKVDGAAAELIRFEAHEALGELFRFTVDVVVKEYSATMDLTQCLGKTATITISQSDNPVRFFHGVVIAVDYAGETVVGKHLRLVMVPRLYLYSKNSEYRLFEEMTAPDIIAQVLGLCNVAFRKKLSATYRKRGYTTQFGESHFDFLSRLMEDEGIYYYFEHAQNSHTLVLCDGPTSHTAGEPNTLEYNPSSRNLNIGNVTSAEDKFVHTWIQSASAHSHKELVLWDNLFSMPGKNLEQKSPFRTTDEGYKLSQSAEYYDFEGTYELHQPASGADDPAEANRHIEYGKARAALRREIMEARRRMLTGVALTPKLACGRTFKLDKAPEGMGKLIEFLMVRVTTVVYGPAFETSQGTPTDNVTEMEAIPSRYVWRSQPVTPKPLAHGPQTAVVVGPAGETIFTDKYGRVKVQFPWDRYGKNDPHSSAWLRVSQTGGLGNIILPRVGHEVLVGFLDGNPDRPIVIGRLFNENNMPLYKLPDHKTRAVWRTLTYPPVKSLKSPFTDVNEKDAIGNELRFEDKADNQEIFLLANKDMNTRIFNDETHWVGHNQETKVLNDSVREVKNNSKVTIDKDSNVTIGQHSTIETKGNEKRDVKGTSTVEIVGNHTVTMKAEASYTTNGKNTIKVDGDDKQDYGGKSEIDVGSTLTIKAGQKILLSVGSNSIEISNTGIKINGTMVKIEGAATAEMSSPMTTVKASGILTAQGSLVKIN